MALAQAEYQLPRLTRMWTHLERQSGSGQVKGMGEKQIEVDKRLLRGRMARLRSDIEEVRRQPVGKGVAGGDVGRSLALDKGPPSLCVQTSGCAYTSSARRRRRCEHHPGSSLLGSSPSCCRAHPPPLTPTIPPPPHQVRTHRAAYRVRRAEAPIPVIALVGYTNAGKSTLLNTLTHAGCVSLGG